MNQFEVFNETEEVIEELETVQKVVQYALEKEAVSDASFSIIIVDHKRIHEINREYRGVDRPTDVISFALEDEENFADIGIRMLGDIYISIDQAKEQATEYGHSLLRELSFLSIHGLLHLLGYDHMEQEEEKIMFEKQKEILDGYGIIR